MIKPTVRTCSFKFEVRQNMLQISNSLHRERHFCFDANPYPTGRRGLRRNRNVWRATSSELSHLELESTTLLIVLLLAAFITAFLAVFMAASARQVFLVMLR